MFIEGTGVAGGSSRSGRAELSRSAQWSEILHRFFARASAKESSEVRAVLLNQVPFVLSWITGHELSVAVPRQTTSQHVAAKGERRSGKDLDWRRLGGLAGEAFRANVRRSSPDAPLLAATLQHNSTRSFLPVALELRSQGIVTHFLALRDDTVSQRLIDEAGFDCDAVSAGVTPRGIWLFARLMAMLPRILSDRSLRGLLCDMDVSTEVKTSARIAELRSALTRQVFMVAPLVCNLKEVLDAHSASHVVYVTHRAIFNTLLTESSYSHRRRVFFLQGVVPDLPVIGTPLDVDLAIAGSRFDLSYMDRCGVPRSKVAITGYPEYDESSGIRRDECRAEIEREVPEAVGRQLVLFTSQYRTSAFSDEARLLNVDVVLRAARLRPETFFLLRPHPRHERLREELAELPRNVAFCPEVPAARAIKAADSLITYWSTTALEAMLFGTPLIQLNATGLPDYLPLVERMGLRPCRNAADLNEVLALLNSPAGRSARLELQASLISTLGLQMPSGGSAERAATAIASTILVRDQSLAGSSAVRLRRPELLRRVQGVAEPAYREGFFRAG